MPKSPIDPKKCPDVLNQFIRYQRVIKMKSEKTIETYFYDLRIFFRFLLRLNGKVSAGTDFDDIDICAVTLADLRNFKKLDALEYLQFTMQQRGNSATTRKRKQASLSTFFACITKDLELLDNNPIKDLDYPKMHAKLPKFLNLQESRKLLSSMNEENPYFTRDYCIITLFINCGMRLSELTGLNLRSIDLDARTIRLLGKGNKERVVHLNDACCFALLDYLPIRAEMIEKNKWEILDALFISAKGRRITNRRVEQITAQAFADGGLDERGFSPHKLRHTAATLMYQHGHTDPILLKEILGHKSVSTTEIYTHVTGEDIADVMDNSPLANVKRKVKK
ncbi:MAG: tyrosine-type recombinase/integrase [Ruminococcus sp.]|jgi:site-specific recombinase XerD|nr:tyrosine-type recombinase/integrase [Ruminococcus sp.]